MESPRPPEVPTWRRHALTLRRFWGTALASQGEYRVNLWIELLATAGNLAGSLFVLSLLYRPGRGLGGWSWEAALVVLGAYTFLDGFSTTLLRPNLSTIVAHVRDGTLDFVLLKPIDSQFWLSTRTLSPWGLPEMVLGLALSLVAAWRSGAQPGPLELAVGGLLVLASRSDSELPGREALFELRADVKALAMALYAPRGHPRPNQALSPRHRQGAPHRARDPAVSERD